MKKTLLLISSSLLAITCSFSQGRYVSEVFPNVNVASNVQYGTAVNILGNPQPIVMDVYTPSGDVASSRATIILIHSGSFLPSGSNPSAPTSWGNKGDSSMVEMCRQLARRGFTAISMTHRLGWNPTSPSQEVRAATIIQAVYRAAQDMRTCIRFLKEDAATANNYKVDTTKIIAGGSSSGGYVAIHGAVLLDTAELTALSKFQFAGSTGLPPSGTPFINFNNPTSTIGSTSYAASWPYLGMPYDGSNQGRSSDYALVFSFGGAVGDTTWINAGETPIICMHGVADPTTPYGTAIVTVAGTGDPIVEVSGSLDVARRQFNIGNIPVGALGANDVPFPGPHPGLYAFVGAANGFEPWNWYNASFALNPLQGKTRALTYIDTMFQYFIPRAVRILQLDTTGVMGINDPEIASQINMYPNPASTDVTVKVNGDLNMNSYKLINTVGKSVRLVSVLNDKKNLVIAHDNLAPGLYQLIIETDKGTINKKLLIE